MGEGKLTLKDMRDELSLWFERMKLKSNEEEDDDREEQAFLAASFKGKCYKCSKIGHKGVDLIVMILMIFSK